MSLKFWDEAFHATTYLINHTPSKVIDFATPLERMFNETPDYSLLHMFGCACWPNLRPYNTCKLQFCSKRCVFIGYGNMHKGYKCLDISTGWVYISQDIVFDEQVFPFSTLHPNIGAQLRAEINLLPPELVSSRGTMLQAPDSGLCSNQIPSENSALEGDFMQGVTSTRPEVDLAPGAAAPTTSAPSTSGSMPAPGESAGAAGESPPLPSSGVLPCAPHQSPPATPDPVSSTPPREPAAIGGQAAAGSADAVAPVLPSDSLGSSVAASPTPDPVSTDQGRPRTRAQDGIRKPKVYTDGTVRYGFLTTLEFI